MVSPVERVSQVSRWLVRQQNIGLWSGRSRQRDLAAARLPDN